MTPLDNLVRREIAARAPQIIACCRKGDLSSIRSMLPSYCVNLPAGFPGKQDRLLSPVNSRKHGKRRIYSDTSYTGQKGNDIYLAYVTKKDLLKLYPMLKTSELLESLGNRWILTIGRAVTSRHETLTAFFNSIVALESTATKKNHPPVGDTTDAWKFGSYVDRLLSTGTPSDARKIICSISRYS